MNEGRLVFSQLMDFFPKQSFAKIVAHWRGNHRVRSFTCMDQFLAMAFAQLTGRESLRDIETCLRALDGKLYHAGLRATVARNTLARANERRPWQIWAELARVMIARARRLYADEDLGLDLDHTIYALDSTTIDLCLTLFPWASFRKAKGGIKLHTLMDLRGNLPATVIITPARLHDVRILDRLHLEPGAIYILDRAYVKFMRLYRIDQAGAFFVTRAKKNFDFRRVYSHPADKAAGVQSDQTITLGGFYPSRDYPNRLRRIRFLDREQDRCLVFLTNHFELPAATVAALYKQRWQIELFFKWIKQHLRIKSFYGTSANAVKTQIWIAITVYAMVAILKKELRVSDHSLYTILQILSVTLFEKMPISQALSQPELQLELEEPCKQLTLFDF